jgi:hypothetical protein
VVVVVVELVVFPGAPEVAGAVPSGEVIAPGSPEVAGIAGSLVVVVVVVSLVLVVALPVLLPPHAARHEAASRPAQSARPLCTVFI